MRIFCVSFLILLTFLLLPHLGKAQMSDAAFFQRINLSFPGLQAVQTHVGNGNYVDAKAAYAQFLRTRTSPNHWISSNLNSNYPSTSKASSNSDAELSISNVFEVKGVRHQFNGPIDWSFNPTDPAQNPGYSGVYIREWTVQFNRTGILRDLAREFKSHGNPAYGTKLNELINDWIIQNPPPAAPPSGGNEFSSGWRTLEAGYRLALYWPEAWRRGIKSPQLQDSTLVRWAKSWMQHGDYLDAYNGTLNWLTTESQGLFTLGVFFPEFDDSNGWRNLAIQRLSGQLLTDVYPDGAFTEIAPHYHRITVENFSTTLKLAQYNNLTLDTAYTHPLERMNEYLLNIMSPDRFAPNLNDGDRIDIKDEFENRAADLFPSNPAFQWVATDGQQGTPPSYTSIKMPWAGQVVMRDSWQTDGQYLLFEYGPHGDGSHQHEDKMGVNIASYGDLFVFEAGRYAYGSSPFRSYCKSSQAHSIITIDEYSQNRDGVAPQLNHTTQPYPVEWTQHPDYAYTMASYGENPNERYGDNGTLRNFGVWRRHILHIKPDIFVIVDVQTPADNNSHIYQSHFHLNANSATADPVTSRITVQEPGRPGFSITPLKEPGLGAEVVTGRENNEILGWEVFSNGTKRAIPTVRFTKQAAGPVTFAYVFRGSPQGSPAPTPELKTISVAPNNFGIMVKWQNNGVQDSARMVVPLSGQAPVIWGGNSFTSPAILIRMEDCTPIDLGTGYQIPGGILPGPWAHQDIGTVGLSGNACEALGSWRVSGSGGDIGSTTDGFHYAYQSLAGDGEIIARVMDIGNSDPLAKGGVMMRESLLPGSKNTLTYLSQSQLSSFQYRTLDNGQTNGSLSAPVTIGFPHWVKLSRVGNTFTGFHSADGQNWSQLSSQTLVMPNTIYVGLSSTSRDNALLNKAIFDSVQVISSGNLLPLTISNLSAKVISAERKIDLFWEVEDDNDKGTFTVERSVDGSFFTPVLNQVSKDGNKSSYEIEDRDPLTGISYYRIKFYPQSGDVVFSNTIQVRLKSWEGVSLEAFPLPCKKGQAFQVRLEVGRRLIGNITLYDLNGKVLWNTDMDLDAGDAFSVEIPTQELSPGLYYLNAFDKLAFKSVSVTKVMVTK